MYDLLIVASRQWRLCHPAISIFLFRVKSVHASVVSCDTLGLNLKQYGGKAESHAQFQWLWRREPFWPCCIDIQTKFMHNIFLQASR